MEQTAEDSLLLALSHLERVQFSWDDPTDWTDLSTYGFYCLEACIVAAALHLGRKRPRNHREKGRAAQYLANEHNLPNIDELLVDLNEMRKHEAYGDTEPPGDLDPEHVATVIEGYVQSVRELLAL